MLDYFLLTSFILFFISILFLFLKPKKQSLQSKVSKPYVISSKDIKAISGDNVLNTQIDLARAYIELGKKELAQKILQHVSEHGDAKQKAAAVQLINLLCG